MFGIGWGEMIVIGLVALVVVGPDRWPELARTLGRFYGQIRQATFEARQTISTEMDMIKAQIVPEEVMGPQDQVVDPSNELGAPLPPSKDLTPGEDKP